MKITALTLAAVLISGCATVPDPVTGEPRQQLTTEGQQMVGLLLMTVVLGAAYAALGGSDDPVRTYKTTYSDGRSTVTRVYER